MYPTKSTCDYMTEINRLFPRPTENDPYRSPSALPNMTISSPFRQSTPVNRSSSSADSLSPDSFPDLSHRSDMDRQSFETPFVVRRQRPIIGRRIFDNTEPPPTLKPLEHDIEFSNSIWQPDEHNLFPPTPPSVKIEQKNYTQNIFYELFPTEKKGFEFKPPVKLSPVSNYTPSPNYSPTTPTTKLPPRMPTSPFRVPSRPNYAPSSSRHQDSKSDKMCTFCRKNGETPIVYMTHCVRENVGNQSIVTCPILSTYCPVLRSSNNGRPLQSTTITLKNTRIKSNGRRRF
ncbi:unnamed protein product [Spodoptera littoralis]|uniref:Nanos-type domain-containing protein n=1 Tax=Spodoptera littoralis TaxID=7109 RepID=A0A9P0I6U8_SPOLI|nr:unnamed protein product [Spodoptera littoralis]CAH1642561.1 unnamed protein product [Spodoptera littoralis]